MVFESPKGTYYRVPCALVLEDEPVGDDSRLAFETYPQTIEEVYALTTYREIGADRMPQPGGVAYRGGNWSTFAIKLVFRAGDRQGSRPDLIPAEASRAWLDRELQTMERKARWCQALAFPLPREAGDTYKDQLSANQRAFAASRGNSASLNLFNEELDKLRRNDPPIVLVVFGAWMTVRGYCTNVSLRWLPPWDPLTTRPYGCEVNLQIQPLMVHYPTWQTIRDGAWSQQASDVSLADVFVTVAERAAQEQDALERQAARFLGETSPPPGGA